MRAQLRRLMVGFFTSAGVAMLTIASSALAIGQAPAAKQTARTGSPKTTGDAPVSKVGTTPTQAQAKAKSAAAAVGNGIPPKPVVDAAAQAKMEQLLVRWEEQSKKVKSLKASFRRTDISPAFNNETTVYQGQARLTPDRLYLDFYEIDPATKKPKALFDQRIVSDGESVYQFLGTTRQIFVYPLDQDPKLRELNQGPLPFLFNMSVARAKERYDMVLQPDTNPDAYVIRIFPKLSIDREEYSWAMVKLSKQRFLPEAIRLFDPVDGQATRTFNFGNDSLIENEAIPAAWFDGKGMANDFITKSKALKNPEDRWTKEVNPRPAAAPKDNAAAPGAAKSKVAAPAGAVGARPAAKNAPVRVK